MPGHCSNQCLKCLGTQCEVKNCTNPKYLYNRDLKCGCKREQIIYKNKFTDTHCCKCKRSFCVYKLDRNYHCKECTGYIPRIPRHSNNGEGDNSKIPIQDEWQRYPKTRYDDE